MDIFQKRKIPDKLIRSDSVLFKKTIVPFCAWTFFNVINRLECTFFTRRRSVKSYLNLTHPEFFMDSVQLFLCFEIVYLTRLSFKLTDSCLD